MVNTKETIRLQSSFLCETWTLDQASTSSENWSKGTSHRLPAHNDNLGLGILNVKTQFPAIFRQKKLVCYYQLNIKNRFSGNLPRLWMFVNNLLQSCHQRAFLFVHDVSYDCRWAPWYPHSTAWWQLKKYILKDKLQPCCATVSYSNMCWLALL